MARETTDFIEILDNLFDQLSDSGAILFPGCHDAVTEVANSIMSDADLQFVPGYKVTELMADLVNIAASISSEGWLSEEEAVQQFATYTSDQSPLVQAFLSDAKMEKARYEPVMLAETYETPHSERNAILRLRLKRMLSARQTYDPLPSSYIRAIRMAGDRAIHAECFATYRAGPMLQFFADMIRQADQIADATFDEFEGVAAINYTLREEGQLWKLYRHKAPRFRAKPGDPLHDGVFATRANMLYIPDTPGAPTIH